MIVTITGQFTSDPSNRERSPTIIWKPGCKILKYNNPDQKIKLKIRQFQVMGKSTGKLIT